MTIVEINTEDNFKELFNDIDYNNENIQKNKVFVDVGGYNGDTVTKALECNSHLKILVIEPIKDLCDLMKQKFSHNPNITIVNKAAYDKKDNLILNEYSGWSNGLSTLQPVMVKLRPEGQFTNRILKYTIEADTIDIILSENNIRYVDYIKIDTEGSEENVLCGFTKYHVGTRFHVESHIINLENILQTLLEMGAYIERITVMRDGNIRKHVVGSVIGKFTRKGQ